MLLPEAQRRDDIKFLLAKSLSYNIRFALIVALVIIGFLIQLILNVWVGAGFLLAATLLSLVEGYSNIPKRMLGKRQWRGATRENLENIIKLNKKSKRWDQSFIDVTCVRGFLVLLLVITAAAGVAYLMWLKGQDWLMNVWIADIVVLVLPHWFSGIRRILKNDPLIITTENLLAIMNVWENGRKEGEVMTCQMEVSTGQAGEIPKDVKLILQPDGTNDKFLGLQVQVTLNNVQGKDYPYLYCVLVARHEFDLINRLQANPPYGTVVEPKPEEQVDIIVIRQQTTKTSGYHTKPSACTQIFLYAVTEARRLFDQS